MSNMDDKKDKKVKILNIIRKTDYSSRNKIIVEIDDKTNMGKFRKIEISVTVFHYLTLRPKDYIILYRNNRYDWRFAIKKTFQLYNRNYEVYVNKMDNKLHRAQYSKQQYIVTKMNNEEQKLQPNYIDCE